jgi:hypothetical protein
MQRLIDANALSEKFEKLKEGANLRDTLYLDGVLTVIDAAPTVEPRRGEWERMINPYGELEGFMCECGHQSQSATNFCSNCGRVMVGGADMRKEVDQ